jgi:hypothetical protein
LISMSSTLERSKWAFKLLLLLLFIKFGYHSFDCYFYQSFFFYQFHPSIFGLLENWIR